MCKTVPKDLLRSELEKLALERDRLREALEWCNAHRDSERFHSVAESALNFEATEKAQS